MDVPFSAHTHTHHVKYGRHMVVCTIYKHVHSVVCTISRPLLGGDQENQRGAGRDPTRARDAPSWACRRLRRCGRQVRLPLATQIRPGHRLRRSRTQEGGGGSSERGRKERVRVRRGCPLTPTVQKQPSSRHSFSKAPLTAQCLRTVRMNHACVYLG